MSKFSLILLCFALLVWPLCRFCHHQTKGFRISKIQDNTSCLPSQTSPPLPASLLPTLEKPFAYLGRGIQSFSFVSEDGSYVLKIFNNRYQRRIFWHSLFRSKEKAFIARQKLEKTFLSYQIATDHLKDESGLLFFHPKACSDCPKVTISDPLGIHHTVDLSKTAYVIQKKAHPSFPYLAEVARKKDWEAAQIALASLHQLIQKKLDLKIADKDPLIRTNIGFCQGRAMQIDLGPFSFSDQLQHKETQHATLCRTVLSLRHFLEENHPELLPVYYEEFGRL